MKGDGGRKDEKPKGGLLCGITPYHVRALCDDAWNGGRGHRLKDVAEMTLDQVLFLLADKKMLTKNKDDQRTESVNPGTLKKGKDGKVAGRAADGTPIRGRVGGKSVVRQLMEKEEKRKRREKNRKRKG